MTSTLRASGPMPFTGADICADLCIDSQYIELLVESVAIAPICLFQHARTETYAVTTGPRFEEEITWASGRRPVAIGPEYELDGVTVRDCRYEPSAERIAKARAAIIAKVMRMDDPALREAIRNGAAACAAKTALKDHLTASLALTEAA